MYRGASKYFKVVRNPEDRYAVWHADARELRGWLETGRYGSENECWDFIDLCEGQQGFIFRYYSGD